MLPAVNGKEIKMTLISRLFFLIAAAIVMAACSREGSATPAPPPQVVPTSAAPVEEATSRPGNVPAAAEIEVPSALISEVLPGIPGANNREFIELYNPGMEALDLDGWSLWYLTREEQDAVQLFAWDERSDIPGLGHYLLVHEGQEFGLLPDGVYDGAMFEGKGGLTLLDASGQVVDRFGWGEAPASYFAGSALAEFEKGNSMERLPGLELGNGVNSGNNAVDFVARSEPGPQNSGSPLAPLPAERLAVSLGYPEEAEPGAEFALIVNVENLSEAAVSDVLVALPVADHFSVVSLPDGAALVDGRASWTIEGIDAGGIHSDTLRLAAPFANLDTLIRDFYAESAELLRAYGQPQILRMDGSAIPIAVARSLPDGSEVTIEGVVTMYPGGFFAGSSSAKFYVEDESGGVQVFADGGRFDVEVELGDLVRVSGRTELFRDSLEVIPEDNLADIETIDDSGPAAIPTEITIVANETDDAVLGRLNVMEGTAERIEEFSYHYEVDLQDEAGERTLLYIEKDTGIEADPLTIGSRYRVTGISELASGVRQLKPRLQSDIVEVFPAVLMLEASAPTNILAGETMSVALTAVNHTDSAMSNVIITAEMADGSSEQWLIYELEGQGGSETVPVQLQVPADAAGIFDAGMFSAVSDQWVEAVLAPPTETYVGEGVPIWAVQGHGSRSPLIGERVTAVGAVTGAFPEMDGFFLQSLEPDGDPATSDGIFVNMESLSQRVNIGDVVEVNGRVREDSGQTILRPAMPADIVLRSEGDAPAIEPLVYDPPADPEEAALYKESLEGMLVTINQPATVVGPTNRYGETILVYDKWNPGLVRRSDGPSGYMMWIDDATFDSHEDQSTLPLAAARGDAISEVTGPLTFTFNNYKIAPLEEPQVTRAQRPLPSLSEATGNQLSIATFNVENMFDAQVPHPDSPPRPSEAAYRRDLQKTAEAIVAMGAPTILALQEVENIEVLQELAAQSRLVNYDYQPVLLEGSDSRGIDQGYLIRGDRATVEAYGTHDAPTELFSRPPLVLTVTVHLDSGDKQLILLNNHFLSLSAGEMQTEPVRSNQAAWNASLVEELRSSNPDAEVIVLGDLNSFYQTKPIDLLQDAGLRHAYEFLSDDEELPYTYIYEGATQTLDHILMSEDLFQNLSQVEALHINADYPIIDPDDDSARRVSDHDPLAVLFTFGE